jgi:uncharacterized protein YjbI with pentapeptide repeats
VDETLVKLLKEKGVAWWNEWWETHSISTPDLSRADLSEEKLNGADFAAVVLNETNLSYSDLTGASLSGATLVGANLCGARLIGADLAPRFIVRYGNRGRELEWERVTFKAWGANLTAANLTRADLSLASLAEASLVDTDFRNATMNQTQLGSVDLSRCRGLETVKHGGPSTIGIDTIYRSGGRIPDIFLRGAGVPEPFIVQMKALVAAMSPIEFYSCFISYSSKDQEFAERLHADLRGKNVRCWFAPEDLKIGDRLRPAFDEAIRVHDKLMVLLSEHSVSSPWVEKEVETAFEKERREKRTVLFPIGLDDAVMETNEAWAADIRRGRHIGDFRDWKKHDSYKKAFERLLRDLKAEG